jgi:diacylglycerol O-acyltransferase / wax synthase
MLDAIPLGPEDRTILQVEGPTVAGHTCKVIAIDTGAPDLAALRAAIAARLPAVPQLTWRLNEDDTAWVIDEDFAVERHVTQADLPAPTDDAGLIAYVAQRFEQRLDRTRPLWHMDLVPTTDGGSALVWRIHHALADGTTSMRFAQELLWDAETTTAPAQAAAAQAADEHRRRQHLAGFLQREFSSSRGRSPFDGRIGTRRAVAFAAIPLGPLHDAAKNHCGATLNDAVLSIVAGALRRWILARHGHLGDVRVRVPVSLHREGDAALNRDSFFSVALPLNEPDPLRRLVAVHEATKRRKDDHDAETMDELLETLGRVSPRLRALARQIEGSPRRFAVNVSNVPGPRAAVSILGAPVRGLHSIAEIGERHALRVSAISLAGTLGFGFCADPEIVDDLELIARGIEEENAALLAATA